MTIRQLFPEVRPSLLLDFMNSETVNPQVPFSRASGATYMDQEGILREAVANQPRIDYDPVTKVCKGLLFENQSTNLITNPRAAGAVAGTPGTVPTNWILTNTAAHARRIVGTGTLNGIPYIDIEYTVSAGAAALGLIIPTDPVGTPNTTYFGSCYMQVISGTAPQMRFVWQDGVNTYNDAFFTVSTSTFTRYQSSFTSEPGATLARLVIGVNASAGGTVFTIRFGGPQTEVGTYVSSLILPPVNTLAASTRAADSLITTSIGSWFNPSAGTWVVSGSTLASGTQPLVSLDDGTTNEEIRIFTSGTDPQFVVRDGAVNQASIDTGTITAGTTFKMVAAYAANDFAASLNGAAVVTDTSGTIPTVDRVRVGTNRGGNQLVGYVEKVAYYPERLNNSQLARLT